MKHVLIIAFCFITFVTSDNKKVTVNANNVINIVNMSDSMRMVSTDMQDDPFFTYEAFSSLTYKLDRCKQW